MIILGTASSASSGNTEPTSASQKAQTLFDEGRLLMLAGQYPAACQKFAESQSLEVASGTLLNLAVCLELQGHFGAAWIKYGDLATLAAAEGHKDRSDLADQRRHALDSRLAHIIIGLQPNAKISGLEISLDGALVEERYWGQSLALDPGVHEVRASAPGRASWSVRVEGRSPSDSLSVQVPVLREADLPADAVPFVVSPVPSASASQGLARASASVPPAHAVAAVRQKSDESQPLASPGSRPNPLLYLAGGTSLALLGIGTYCGVHAMTEWDRRQEHCHAGVCDAVAFAAGKSAQDSARLADVMVGIGLIGLGLDLYWVLSSGQKDVSGAKILVTPVPLKQEGRISFEGTF